MTKTEFVRSPVGYMAKYSSKGFDHGLPRSARFSGSEGLDESRRSERAWWLLPAYARSAFNIADAAMRAVGGDFISRVTGHWVQSDWKLYAVGRGMVRLVYIGAPAGCFAQPEQLWNNLGKLFDLHECYRVMCTKSVLQADY